MTIFLKVFEMLNQNQAQQLNIETEYCGNPALCNKFAAF